MSNPELEVLEEHLNLHVHHERTRNRRLFNVWFTAFWVLFLVGWSLGIAAIWERAFAMGVLPFGLSSAGSYKLACRYGKRWGEILVWQARSQ